MKKKKLKKLEEELLLELEGKVFIVEKLGNKELSRSELPGDLVLRCVLKVLEQSLKSEKSSAKG